MAITSDVSAQSRGARRRLVGIAAIAALVMAGVVAFAGPAAADARLGAADRVAPTAPATSRTYTDPQGRFTIVPPPGWTAKPGDSIDTGVPGIVVFFFPPRVAGDFQPNINVLAQPSGTADAVTVNRRELQRLDGYTAIADQPVTLSDGTRAHAFAGTFTYQGVKLRNVQLLAASKDSTLVVTGTALATQWPTYGTLLESSLGTFTTTTESG